MSKLVYCVAILLFVGACVGQNPCLYSSSSNKILTPLVLLPNLCPNNLTNCMVVAYKYGNFQYNGPAALKPERGEIVMFLSKYPDAVGSYHLVTMLNANVSTTMNVTLTKTDGTGPATIELYDDPIGSTDSWAWDFSTNTGKFQWITLPTYTDGCIIGPMTFQDNYCIKAVFTQPNNAIQKISIMSGNSSAPQKILTAAYTSGSTFEFCQYPQTVTFKKDVSCPGFSDGAANISISYGPTSATYSWVNASGATIGTGQSISNLKAGTYTANVVDSSSNHCNAQRTVIISGPTAPSANVTTTPFACSTSGTASAAGTGGSPPYTYTWKQGATTLGTGSSISGLAVGTYSVVVADSCGTTSPVTFTVGTVGCCGDGICQASEACVNGGTCTTDCGTCCPVGTYVTGSTCTVCPAGSYSTTPGSASCTNCPANTYNAGGNSACTACPDNTQSSAGSGVCTNCAAGTIRASGETSCHSCGAGYVPNCGAATCSACPAGTYSLDNWSACQTCNAGTYSSTSGSATCSVCAANTYAAAGATSCTACPTGTTSPAGSSHILAC